MRRAPKPRAAAALDSATGDAMAQIEVQQADITKLEVDAIANAANTDLKHGGGVAGAIVRAGGRIVQDESDELAPIGLGEAVATSAGEMPAKWVIHAATMRLGGPTSAEIIRRATAATLAKADELGAKSLALVAFGTGVGGFPVEEAARIEVEEVRRHLDEGGGLERVVFAVFGEEARRAFEGALGGRFSAGIRRTWRAKLSAWIRRRAWGLRQRQGRRPGRRARTGKGVAGPGVGLAQGQELDASRRRRRCGRCRRRAPARW